MEAIDFFDNVKVEKANAILKYNRLRNIAKLFRLIEICLVLVLVSWISCHLPVAVRVSGEYFKVMISFVLSPIFIFVLCNVIVVALLLNSGKLSGQFTAESDLFEDFLNQSSPVEIPAPEPEPEPIVYEDKNMNTPEPVETEKFLQRCSSENMKIVCAEKQSRKLRRTETEKNYCEIMKNASKEKEETVEKLSNEEFQKTIEAFIARQVKFHQQEKSAIVAPPEGFNDCSI